MPNSSSENVDVLVTQPESGDPDAFAALMAPLKSDLWGFLLNHTTCVSDAEDLFQEICLKIANKLHTLKDRSRFRSWVFSIAINSVRSFFRKPMPIVDSIDDDSEGRFRVATLESATPNPEDQLAQREKLAFLRQCLAELADKEREILLLDAMSGMSQKDIARLLDVNLNTVKTIIRRTRIKLARRMAEEYSG